MAKKAPPAQNAAPSDQMVKVRALVDFHLHDLKAGKLARVPAGQVDMLTELGVVDPHPDAVAYAESLERESPPPDEA